MTIKANKCSENKHLELSTKNYTAVIKVPLIRELRKESATSLPAMVCVPKSSTFLWQ